MDFKNAVAVCLITLFSASIVVLIARALDIQAANRLELQLERIASELEAIRKGGGMAAGEGEADTIDNGIIVYYVHSNRRCVTCRSIESQALAVINGDFAEQVAQGKMVWRAVNVDRPAGKKLAKSLGATTLNLVVVRMKDGRIEAEKKLNGCAPLIDDKAAFAKYVREGIEEVLGDERETLETKAASDVPAGGGDSDDGSQDIQITPEAGGLPVP
jgi:hypothetical protein